MKRHLKTNLFIICVLASSMLFSQDLSVSGIVKDKQNTPISYANVVLLSVSDSTAVKGGTSDEKGLFRINNVDKGSYILKTSFVGFTSVFKNISVESNDVEVDDIVIEESAESLDEVSISYKKPTLQKEADRLVFNVANSALSEGNLMEVIKSTPSVLVLDGSIMVKNTTPTIYINDRKVQLTGSELASLLEGSPANSIKSVEVITNPSSKYDAADGIVLNIVMIKNLITGYRGTVFGNYTQGVFPRYNVGMTNYYKTDKINVFASYSYNQDKINRASDESINYLDNGSLTELWLSNFNRNTWSKKHNLNINFDYFLDDNNTLSFAANALYLPYFKYFTNGYTDVYDDSNAFSYSFRNKNLSYDNKYNLGFDLDFIHRFENSSKLSVNFHLTTYDYERDQSVESVYNKTNGDFDYFNLYNTESNQDTKIYTSQVDYNLPLNDESSIDVGLKNSFINSDSDITQYDIIGGISTYNPANSDDFEYNENIFAGYANYEKNWEKVSLSAGMRVEQTNADGESNITGETITQNYFEWFPTASISYQLSDALNIYSNYKRSIERPSYQSLNPFKYFLNDNTIIAGNPNLNPAITDHAVFGISIIDMFSVEAYYKNIDGNFLELPIQDNQNNLLIYTPTNLTRTVDYGFDFAAYFSATDRWYIYIATSFYNVKDEANINNETLEMDMWSNYSIFSNDFSFLKDNSLSANLTLTYVYENLYGFQIVETRLISDLTIKKMIWNNKGALSLAVSDIFNTQDFTVTSKYLNQDNSRFFDQDTRYIKLGFSYKFGNTGLATNQRTKEKKERDRLEKD